jgi:hypothetical protein
MSVHSERGTRLSMVHRSCGGEEECGRRRRRRMRSTHLGSLGPGDESAGIGVRQAAASHVSYWAGHLDALWDNAVRAVVTIIMESLPCHCLCAVANLSTQQNASVRHEVPCEREMHVSTSWQLIPKLDGSAPPTLLRLNAGFESIVTRGSPQDPYTGGPIERVINRAAPVMLWK